MNNATNKSGYKQNITKKILGIAGNVLIYIIIAFALFVLVITVTAKKDRDGDRIRQTIAFCAIGFYGKMRSDRRIGI